MKLTHLVLTVILTPFMILTCDRQPSQQPPVLIRKDAAVKKKSVDAVLIRKHKESVKRRAEHHPQPPPKPQRKPIPPPEPQPFELTAETVFAGCTTYNTYEGDYVTVDFMKGCWLWESAAAVIITSNPKHMKPAAKEAATVMMKEFGTDKGLRIIMDTATKDPDGRIYPVIIFGIPRATSI